MNREKESRKDNLIYILYALMIFIIMYVFYTNVEPIMVCDPDDWTYVGSIRKAYPIWKAWNPAKVLPETLEGFWGYFSAYVVYPLCGDYIRSFTYVFAFFVSAAISVYIIAVVLLLHKGLKVKLNIAVIASFITFLAHFIILRDSLFLFTASNLNCFMNYLIPLLLNVVLLMSFVIKGCIDQRDNFFIYCGKCRTSSDYIKLGGVFAAHIYRSIFEYGLQCRLDYSDGIVLCGLHF